ncbi:MAG: hypothetical protein HXY37_12185 [Chloroflexi bacterium]|nr:hypothetical protein [Chloroflexota bacterium]
MGWCADREGQIKPWGVVAWFGVDMVGLWLLILAVVSRAFSTMTMPVLIIGGAFVAICLIIVSAVATTRVACEHTQITAYWFLVAPVVAAQALLVILPLMQPYAVILIFWPGGWLIVLSAPAVALIHLLHARPCSSTSAWS